MTSYLKSLIILLVLAMAGCNTPRGERTTKDGYSIIKIDGCEYIEVKDFLGANNGYYSLTHKGDCSNPIHRYPNKAPSVSQ